MSGGGGLAPVKKSGTDISPRVAGDDFLLPDGDKLQVGTGKDGVIYSSSDDLYIENDTSNKDIIFKVNDGGVDTEVVRIQGSTSRVNISTNLYVGSATYQSNGEQFGIFASAGNLSISAEVFSTSLTDSVLWQMKKSHHATIGTLVTTLDNEVLGNIVAYGLDDAEAYKEGGNIRFIQNGTVGVGHTNVPTDIEFSTSPGGAAGSNLRHTIDYNGNHLFQLPTAQPSAPTNSFYLTARDSSDLATTLALYTEQAPEAIATFTQTHRLKVWINNVEYWLSLDAV